MVCGEADSIPGAASKIAECQPQVVLTELQLGADDTLKLIRQLKAEHRALRILVYSTLEEIMFAERAIRAGANGYVMKRAPRETLTAAVRDVVKVGMYVSREVALSGFRKSLQRRPKNGRSPRSADALEDLSQSRDAHFPIARFRDEDERHRTAVGFKR